MRFIHFLKQKAFLCRDLSEVLHIYTDGSSLGNPGPGGYGVILRFGKIEKELSEGYRLTTNNRMELLAVIVALESLKRKDVQIVIHTDSQYVVNAVEKGWVFGWQKKGFKDKANPDLWQRFLPLYHTCKPKFKWVRGHAGHTENERCDVLAREAASRKVLKTDHGYEGSSTLFSPKS